MESIDDQLNNLQQKAEKTEENERDKPESITHNGIILT